MSFGPARKASGLVAAFGAGALAFGGPADAQTVADNARIPLASGASPECLKYRNDAPSYAQCEYNESVRRMKEYQRAAAAADARGAAADARGAEADKQAAAADRRNACTTSFIAEIKASPERLQAARNILGGKSIREVDPCSVLEQLKKG